MPSGLIVMAPIRPAIAPNRWAPPGLRRPCTIGFGPSPPHAASNVVGPAGALPFLSPFAALAPSARCAPACVVSSGSAPAVRRLMKNAFRAMSSDTDPDSVTGARPNSLRTFASDPGW